MYNPKSSYQSPQSIVLRFMREKRQLKLLQVGKDLGIKPKVIDHMENGRKIFSEEEILIFLKYYNYSLDTFNEMLKLNPLNKQAANHYFLKYT